MAYADNARWSSAAAALSAFEATKLYDVVAATPLVAWYVFCLAQRTPQIADQIAGIDVAVADFRFFARLASELASQIFLATLAVLLVVRCKPRGKARGLYPRIAAVGGTFLGASLVLLPPRDLSAPLYLASTLLILGGTIFAIYAVLSLGRSLSMMPEARQLVTRGPYGLIRHPLYLSEAVALIGLTIQFLSPLALAVLVVQCAFQIERMKNEEGVLSRVFPQYQDYMARTARLVPGIY